MKLRAVPKQAISEGDSFWKTCTDRNGDQYAIVQEDQWEVIRLKRENEKLEKQVPQSGGSIDNMISVQISRLHEYNRVKDAVQSLLGRLAELEQTTCKDLYSKYDLELDD